MRGCGSILLALSLLLLGIGLIVAATISDAFPTTRHKTMAIFGGVVFAILGGLILKQMRDTGEPLRSGIEDYNLPSSDQSIGEGSDEENDSDSDE